MGQSSGLRVRILLINPNSLEATTAMMVAIATSVTVDGFEIVGATATRAPSMIVTPEALDTAAPEVEEIALAHRGALATASSSRGSAIPASRGIKSTLKLPAVGIGEAAMLEAAEGGRRFGVATTTPLLKAKIDTLWSNVGIAIATTPALASPTAIRKS